MNHRHKMTMVGMDGNPFENKVEKTINVPTLSKCSVRKHIFPDGESDESIEMSEKIGCLDIMCRRPASIARGNGDYRMELSVNSEVSDDNSSLDICMSVGVNGSLGECSDRIISSLVKFLSELDVVRKSTQEAIDFFAGTMLGNGELSKKIEKYEEHCNEMARIREEIARAHEKKIE